MSLIDKLPLKMQAFAPKLEALLNIIPYAGGSLASILNNHMSEKKWQKILDAIELLEKTVKVNDIVIEKLLTEDQACELIEKHITEIAVSSDETKVEYLKNSLKNSFSSSSFQFEEKELFMNTLKTLTGLEIILLKQIYLTEDPFVEKTYPQDLTPPVYGYQNSFPDSDEPLINAGAGTISGMTYVTMSKKYIKDSESYKTGGKSLEQYFKEKFQKEWSLLNGACSILDSKGLTTIKENLDNKVYKEIKMKLAEGNPLFINGLMSSTFSPSFLNNGTILPVFGKDAQTPFEASQTDFGKKFIEYITR